MSVTRPTSVAGPAPGRITDPPPGPDAVPGDRGLELAARIDVLAGELTRLSDTWLAGAPPTHDELHAVASRLRALHRSITGRPMPSDVRRS